MIAVRWLRDNLFSAWYNALLTVAGLALVYDVVSGVLRWALTAADWRVVVNNLTVLAVGAYPRDQLWRVWASGLIVTCLSGLSWGIWGRPSRDTAIALAAAAATLVLLPFSLSTRLFILAAGLTVPLGFGLGRRLRAPTPARRLLVACWLLSFLLVTLLIHGDGALLPPVRTDRWGGLLLTLMLAVVGIVGSFPFGVALALGRTSSLPVVRAVSIAYIELFRGVPLVTVLFSTQIMLTLFLPEGLRPDRVLRAMAGLVLFTAAYVAENVRGGLQSVPRGQIEAAGALGLNGFQTTVLVVLPQALRAVIPSMVGQFISLFKDTSLVAIVGLQELLGIANSVLANPDYLGRYAELYVFVALIYWICSYGMSCASRRLERQLGVGER